MEKVNKKILIVDDDNFLLDMYSLKFTERGFSVDSSLGSVDLIQKLRSGATPDILLLDIVMPTMDGFEVLEAIKKENLAKGAVKIILSNRGQKEDVDRGISLGAKGYIVKATATPTEVVDKVIEIIESSQK
jgi:CheY-like chemotaxis protein